MGELTGSPALGAIAALGYALTKQVLTGLAAEGGWVFPLMACCALAWSALRPIAEREAPYAFFRHVIAVIVAALLLYGARPVDLSAVVGDRLATSPEASLSAGAAPWPTYVVDVIGTAVSNTAKRVVARQDALLIPMLSTVVREATANPANAADRQTIASLALWRWIAAAALRADARLAQEIDRRGLRERLMSPVPPNPDYSSATAVSERRAVVGLLDAAAPGARLPALVCENGAALARIATEQGAAPWAPDSDCALSQSTSVAASLVGPVTLDGIARAQSSGSLSDTALTSSAARGAQQVAELIAETRPAATVTRFANLSSVYQALGSAALLSAAVQAAQDASFKVLLGEQCAQKGTSACRQSFAPIYGALGDAVDSSTGGRPTTSTPGSLGSGPGGFWKSIAGSIAYVVGALMMLFAKLVAALTPFGIAIARAVAVLIGLLGVFVILLPGRAVEGVQWMIGPIAWANLWSLLFAFWWKLSETLIDWGERLFWQALTFSGDGISAAAVIQFVCAVGYTTLPYIAWRLVFSGAERLMPQGVGHMISPATGLVLSTFLVTKMRGWFGHRASGVPPPGGGGPGGAPNIAGAPLPSNPPTMARSWGTGAAATASGSATRPHGYPASRPG